MVMMQQKRRPRRLFDRPSAGGWGVRLDEFVYANLGTPECRHCMENAQLTWSELDVFCRMHLDIDFSPITLHQIVREFREDVLKEFFTAYPEAAWLRDWHDVADAVSVFTTEPNHIYSWRPKFRAVQDAMNKFCIMANAHPGIVRWYPDIQEVRVYNPRTMRLKRRRRVVPSSLPSDCDVVSSIYRVDYPDGTYGMFNDHYQSRRMVV